jgi:DNA modification methylase
MPEQAEIEVNSNVMKKADLSVHDWYRFVLSFPPHLVQKYLEQFKSKPKTDTILDPFCGTGTTLVEGKKLGFRVFGCDAHPFAALVSQVKTNWSLDVADLQTSFERVKRRIERQTRIHLGEPGRTVVNGFQLSDDEAKLMPEGFVSPLPLLRLLIVRDAILETELETPVRNVLLVALAHTIANGAGNFAFGPEIYRTKAKDDYAVNEHFTRQVITMISELENIQETTEFKPSKVLCADARKLTGVPDDISRVITSPPYPNEKDYTRTTRVESVLLKVFSDKAGMRKVKNRLLRSNTRNIFVKDDDGKHVAEFESIQRICQEIEGRRIELNKTSGFEKLYHKVVAHYFGGMRLHFRSLKSKLRRGAKLAYVVGDQMSFLMVKVPTAQLLAEIARAEGYEVTGCDLWRERVGTKVKNCRENQKTVRVREEVLLLKKP